MTTLLLATAILTGSTAAPAPLFVTPQPTHVRAAHDQPTWDDVAQYIALNASRRDAATEALLRAEVFAGKKTWRLYRVSSGGGKATGLLRDGIGMGWPVLGLTIQFDTDVQANTAASLLDAATFNAPAASPR